MAPERAFQFARAHQQFLDGGQQAAAGLVQLQALADAVEQPHVELLLEPGERVAGGGLRHRQLLRGVAERLRARGGQEYLELPQGVFHYRDIRILILIKTILPIYGVILKVAPVRAGPHGAGGQRESGMSNFNVETVTSVRHWNDTLFSFTTTRDSGFRFRNGHFMMIGLEVGDRPLVRAYSIASANYEEELEFFSIKVPDGPLTSRLQHLREGDAILVSRKPTGTLVLDNLLPGRNLYLLGTGTGLAPFLSIIRDPETYERFEHVILTHGVRTVSDLAYSEHVTQELPQNEFFGERCARSCCTTRR